MTLEELKNILMIVYDKTTVHYKWKVKWSKDNPTFGQCVPTALLVEIFINTI